MEPSEDRGALAGCTVSAAAGLGLRYTVRAPGAVAQWWRPLPPGLALAPPAVAALCRLEAPGLLRVRGAPLVQLQQYLAADQLSSEWRCLPQLLAPRRRLREQFLWATLHQLATLARALHHASLPQGCTLRFAIEHIFVKDCQLMVDPFHFTSKDSTDIIDEFPPCQNVTCSIGAVIYEMCTFTKYSKTDQLPFKYSDDLKNLILDLLHQNGNPLECSLNPSILLHHPIVLSNMDDSKEIYCNKSELQTSTPSNDSAFESDESAKMESLFSTSNLSNIADNDFDEKSVKLQEANNSTGLSPTIAALDLKMPGYVPRKLGDNVKKWKSRLELYKEPREVSEDALSKVWLERLKTLKDRETAVELKEREFAKKVLFDEIRSKILSDDQPPTENAIQSAPKIPGITLQTVMNEKLLIENKHEFDDISETKSIPRDFVQNLRTVRHKPRRRSVSKTKSKRKTITCYEDIDSSLSADPGDSSFMMTSTKISSNTVRRPSGMCNLARKKVHFNSRNNPFAEYDSISGTVFTFDDEDNTSYEIPVQKSPNPDSVVDRIAKFTYLDLEAMTNKKRSLMDEWRKSPPKMKLVEVDELDDFNIMKAPPVPVNKRVSRKSKYPSPRFEKCSSTSHVNYYSSNSESSGISVLSLPCSSQMKDRRKSMPFLSMSRNQIFNKTPKKNTTSENKENSNIVQNGQMVNAPPYGYNLRSSKSADNDNVKSSESVKTPVAQKEKRKSIFSFKTPFKFQL